MLAISILNLLGMVLVFLIKMQLDAKIMSSASTAIH